MHPRITTPHQVFLDAIPFLDGNGVALDIGAGYLNESRHLAALGYSVIAIDKEPLPDFVRPLLPPTVTYIQADFTKQKYPLKHYSALVALFSLSFVPPDQFNTCVERLVASVAAGGIIIANVFGDTDEWSTTRPNLSFFSCRIFEKIIVDQGLEIIRLAEKKWRGAKYDGTQKEWHTIDVICRKVA